MDDDRAHPRQLTLLDPTGFQSAPSFASTPALSIPPEHHEAPIEAPKKDRRMPRSDGLTLSVKEGAELLGISKDLCYDLVAAGELPALRLGRRIRLPTAALMDLVASARPTRPEDRLDR